MNYRCIVQYDGTRYEGWQKQKRTEETIQGKLEKALRKITGEEVQVIGAGRTDAGVHSLGQAVNFHLKGRWKAEELETALNGYLPDDIALRHMETAEERFHSRFDAVEKYTGTGSAHRRRKMCLNGAWCGSMENLLTWKR